MSRQAYVAVEINGTNISEDISGDILSVTYTDNADERTETDSLDITIQNRTKRWMRAWFPQTGDTLQVRIVTREWSGSLNCGSFILDDVEVSGWPLTVTMRALAIPMGSGFTEICRNRTWEQARLSEIAETLAANSSIPLEYEAVYNPQLSFVSQTDRTDRDFLRELCVKYGLTMKLYSNRIVLYDMAEYEKNGGVVTLTEQDITSFAAHGTITKAGYTGCVVRYTDRNGQTLEYTHEIKGRTSKVFRHVIPISSLAEAERVAISKLRELNMGETTFRCTLPGNTELMAGMCIHIKGFGNFDGKYFIDQATHRVGGGYTTDLQMHRGDSQ